MAAAVPPAAALPPVFTVHDAMVAAGVNDADNYNGRSSAQRIAADIFDDDFSSCMDKTHEDMESDFKSFSTLTAVQGQIRLLPGVKKRIKAFVQWVKDEVRLGREPSLTPFPAGDTANLVRRCTTHKKFVSKSSTLSDAAKPVVFGKDVKWVDWAPSFLNYLRTIPGRDGVPLKYICRKSDTPIPTPNPDFLDDYVAMAPLTGEAFTIDAAEVYTLIVKFIAGNELAESKILQHAATSNGREAFESLVAHYEGVGLHSVDIIKADETLQSLFYSGEKRPHMWWDEFERNEAFISYDKKELRVVHSNEMKLRILIKKIGADFLANTKAGIGIELAKPIVTMTYEQALTSFRNEVNTKHPPGLSHKYKSKRNINEIESGNRPRGRGRGRSGGRGGRGGRGDRGGYGRPKRTRDDSSYITLTDGREIEYHPSFRFPAEIFNKMKNEDREMMKQQRESYKRKRSVQAVATAAAMAALQNQQNPPGTIATPNAAAGSVQSQISQLTGQQSTMMGGRNERTTQNQNQNRGQQ